MRMFAGLPLSKKMSKEWVSWSVEIKNMEKIWFDICSSTRTKFFRFLIFTGSTYYILMWKQISCVFNFLQNRIFSGDALKAFVNAFFLDFSGSSNQLLFIGWGQEDRKAVKPSVEMPNLFVSHDQSLWVRDVSLKVKITSCLHSFLLTSDYKLESVIKTCS